jgi:hypothetical protein
MAVLRFHAFEKKEIGEHDVVNALGPEANCSDSDKITVLKIKLF